MPHDPVLIEEVRAWMRRANDDMRAADLELSVAPPLTCDAVFHAQQATEKA
jgi:HEPN domain-containing protein